MQVGKRLAAQALHVPGLRGGGRHVRVRRTSGGLYVPMTIGAGGTVTIRVDRTSGQAPLPAILRGGGGQPSLRYFRPVPVHPGND